MRLRTRLCRVERLYAVKSKPRESRRWTSSASNSGGDSLVVMAVFAYKPGKRRRDVFQAQHEVDVTRRDRGAGHAEELRARFVLGDDRAPHLLHRHDTQ